MWNEFVNSLDSHIKIDMKNSMYVGDALGRVGDWSDSDKIFADTIGLQTICPETMFPFENRHYNDLIPLPTQEIILMMGFPGSGKTYFTLNHIPDTYTKLHGDDLKTHAKKKKYITLALERKQSVVLDASHPTKESRQHYVHIAKKFRVPIRLVHIQTNFDQSKAQNSERSTKVPLIALYVYRKKFEKPSLDEGFHEIIYA